MSPNISTTRFVTFCVASLLTMLTGAQCVHKIYKPLDDLEDLVEQRLQERRKELQKE
ncbi:PREDICTED: uncharacterized protein LOC105453811 [Wasmannia auropunctata]|uniref:uncharacterized protein LOC105453811 n=1 Tax=Wasmannia auropunctata TaxID=64793 RepID=UPI0005EE0A08|nr:PREDICTED: uncharacterized protein LOC105453811 [Wasmannia auropunctata]